MPIQLEFTAVALALVHVVAGVVVLIAAKLIKDLLSPYRVESELTSKDNPAFGLAVAGYYAGAVAVYIGAARVEGLPLDAGTAGVLRVLGFDLAWALAGVVALNLSRALFDGLLIPGARVSEQILKNRNVAAGAVEGANYIASGLVLAGAIGQPGGNIATTLALFLLAQVVLIGLGRVYQKLAGYDCGGEICSANLAAGAAMGLTTVALAILMVKATSGEFVDWATNLSYFAIDAIGGFLLLMLLRWVVDAALLPNARIQEEVVRDRNVNVGLVEGTLAVGIAVIIFYLL